MNGSVFIKAESFAQQRDQEHQNNPKTSHKSEISHREEIIQREPAPKPHQFDFATKKEK